MINRILRRTVESTSASNMAMKCTYDFLPVVLHRRSFSWNAVGILEITRQDAFEGFDGVVVLFDELRKLSYATTDVDCGRRIGDVERGE